MAVALCGVALIWLSESLAKARDLSDGGRDAAARGYWAMGMAVVFGLALAGIRRGPEQQRGTSYAAAVICLLGIGWAAISLTFLLLK
ncbi:MAG: hypothetical protein U0871_03445 [Gemmataceae bacterium]